MYFEEPVGRATKGGSAAHWAILIICTLLISPLGFLLTRGLQAMTDTAAAGLFPGV